MVEGSAEKPSPSVDSIPASSVRRPCPISKGVIRRNKNGREWVEPRSLNIPRGMSSSSVCLSSSENSQSPSFAASLLDNNAVYKFRIVNIQNLTSSAGGTISFAISCNPSTTSFTNWADLIDLFSEVRMVQTSVRLANIDPNYTAIIQRSMTFGYDDGETSLAPALEEDVFSLGESKVHMFTHLDVVTQTNKCGSREWAKVGSPAPGTYAGCYGQWSFYGQNLSASTTYVRVYTEIVVELRNRGGS